MDLTGKKFSIVQKMRGMLIFGIVLWTLCLVNTVRVVMDFQGAFIEQNLLVKFVSVLLLFVMIFVTILFSVSPFRYWVVEGGIQIDSLIRKTVVRFEDVDSVVVDVPTGQRTPEERVVLFVGRKTYFIVGLANDFELLRDHVMASVDPAIVEDRRKPVEEN